MLRRRGDACTCCEFTHIGGGGRHVAWKGLHLMIIKGGKRFAPSPGDPVLLTYLYPLPTSTHVYMYRRQGTARVGAPRCARRAVRCSRAGVGADAVR